MRMLRGRDIAEKDNEEGLRVGRTPRICFNPARVRGFSHLAGGEGERFQDGVYFGGCETITIQLKKQNACRETDAFIAIDKWVVFGETESVGSRQFEDGWFAVSEKVFRSAKSGIEHTLVTNAGGTAVFGQKHFLNSEHYVAPHPNRRFHLASSRSVLR